MFKVSVSLEAMTPNKFDKFPAYKFLGVIIENDSTLDQDIVLTKKRDNDAIQCCYVVDKPVKTARMTRKTKK